jgi:hypothetical protein
MTGSKIIDLARGPTIGCLSGPGGVSAFQAVMLYEGLAYPADGENPTHAGYVIGMAMQAITQTIPGRVITSGKIVNQSWDLVPGSNYFLAVAGTISTTPPTIGFQQKMGIAKDAHTLIIMLGEAVLVI